MNSFNHYSLGSVVSWLYSCVLGIQRDEKQPGFRHFFLKPCVKELVYAKGGVETPYGRIESGWSKEEERIRFRFLIPANSRATLLLPAGEVTGGGQYAEGNEMKNKENGIQIELTAGEYIFEVTPRKENNR